MYKNWFSISYNKETPLENVHLLTPIVITESKFDRSGIWDIRSHLTSVEEKYQLYVKK